ncbi:SBF-like CPA transporter family-domain-containing protein [Phycomyces blakesleeanus]|uniref:Uncharacterized protein n=2 Tax=Phycomyces blakesleeanus TaxID=4837 RepID=A0A167PVS4_PHYB8|nr:hypothetical protein PHYBLDRAFT_179620 [Phycomyces blakesleeanus NRRL 1555(-)]OAD78626.1 hypothetical protein PHYBLDRAFT_179620 [Phycomyces blakesleeanus NRRL 1555(-)]|eukprot:XP_018296666.1 hypothetical protein PHYBLDRAFT_179620 [Phycomyces blakesleeanus NRRL 1555(-)]
MSTTMLQPSEASTVITVRAENISRTPSQAEQQSSKYKILFEKAKVLYFRYWFLLGLAIAIGLAWAFPQVGKSHGSIQAQYTVKWGAVILIFLLSGLGLEVKVMVRTILRWRLHLLVQAISFLLMPFVLYGIVRFLSAVNADIDPVVYQGLIIALSTSTTVSSNAVMTRNADGNDSAALLNAALGNTLGIFISPALMTVFGNDKLLFPPGSAQGVPDYLNVLKNLGLTVLLPLVVGQIIRYIFPVQIKYLAVKLKFSIINSLALLCMVWSVFCDGVATHAFSKMSASDTVAMIGVDIFMYLFGCTACIVVGRLPWPHKLMQEPAWLDRWRFSRKDTVAIMYCGATKTVSMGIPLINVLYADSSVGVVGVLSLPLLMYHICQLFIGNFQVPLLKRWVHKDKDEQDTSESIPLESTLPQFTTRRRANEQLTESTETK